MSVIKQGINCAIKPYNYHKYYYSFLFLASYVIVCELWNWGVFYHGAVTEIKFAAFCGLEMKDFFSLFYIMQNVILNWSILGHLISMSFFG